ncbi:transmembrane protein 35B isoform X2 [Antechinus flavipes]|uniref:transmembrane protein 35B isoform X1 n=1 Tax=Antechinus flavipes TaxID=38775 RepID=UPI002235AECA|nr:transmembrane protein 35B isoform X1 [Antechinus flavipes]XP_051843610.1 transmembrane protein 35B isoform X2 [Antechinus flavipes]
MGLWDSLKAGLEWIASQLAWDRSLPSGRPRTARETTMLVFAVLRLLLGLFFMLTGAVKLSECRVPGQAYVQMRAQAAKLAHVLPLKSMGFNPDPGELLVIIGWVELVSGLLLALGPPLLQDISIILLLLLSVGTVYSLLLLKEPVSSWAPPAICLGLLFLLSTRACHLF